MDFFGQYLSLDYEVSIFVSICYGQNFCGQDYIRMIFIVFR